MADRRACDACGSLYQPLRASSRYCGQTCRKRAQRSGVAQAKDPDRERPTRSRSKPAATVSSVRAAVLEELKTAGKETTALGQAALALASRVDFSQGETGSAFAALTKELRAVLAAAVGVPQPAGDALDELAAKRKARLAGDG